VPLVAFNASFDLLLLDAELRRHGLPTLAERLGREVGPVLDPLVLDRSLDGDRTGPRRLVDLCAHYGVSTGRLHTADADVVATLDVLDAIARRHPELAAMDAPAVHEYQVAARRAWAEARAARRAAAERARRAGTRAGRVRALLRRLLDALGVGRGPT
jgi:DNA polymerase-3 subunit epsilon